MRFAPVSRNLAKLLDIKSLKILDNYAQFNPVPLSVEQFLQFGKGALESESYHFLKKELPVRFANIMKEINLLPAALLQMPSVQDLQVRLSFFLVNIPGVVYPGCSQTLCTKFYKWERMGLKPAYYGNNP